MRLRFRRGLAWAALVPLGRPQNPSAALARSRELRGDDDELRAAFDGVAGLDEDFFDGAGDLGGDSELVFHFHRFDDDEGAAGFDGVALFHEDLDDLAGHRGFDESRAATLGAGANAVAGGALMSALDDGLRSAAAGEDRDFGVAVDDEVEHAAVDANRDGAAIAARFDVERAGRDTVLADESYVEAASG